MEKKLKMNTWLATVAVKHSWLPVEKLEQFEFNYAATKGVPTVEDVEFQARGNKIKNFKVVSVIKL